MQNIHIINKLYDNLLMDKVPQIYKSILAQGLDYIKDLHPNGTGLANGRLIIKRLSGDY